MVEVMDPLPFDFADGIAVVVDDELYFIGVTLILAGSSKYTISYKYNKTDNTISKIARIPYYFEDGGCVVLDGEIHVLGSGYNSGESTSPDFTYSKKHYKYNPSTNVWTSVSTVPYEFFEGCITVLDGEIHILSSGYYYYYNGYYYPNKYYHYKYNPSTNVWTSVSTVTYDCSGGFATVLDEEIHIFGGDNAYHYKFDSDTGEWIKLSNLPVSFNDFGNVIYDSKLHIFGGSESKQYIYDTDADVYKVSRAPYNYITAGHVVVLDNKIHLLGSTQKTTLTTVLFSKFHHVIRKAYTDTNENN